MQNTDTSLIDVLLTLPRSAWFHLAAICSGVALALLGPFGTYESMNLPAGLVFWVSICWLNAIQCTLIAVGVLRRWGAADATVITPALILVIALLNALPGTLEVFSGLRLLGDNINFSASQLFWLYLQTTFITTILLIVFQLLSQWRIAADNDNTAENSPSGFDQRIPKKITGQLLAVSAEDHYLRITTDQGDALVPGRFGDALKALPSDDGLRIHRSHWVAFKAIDRVQRKDGKAEIVLTNGLSLPVSRSYTAALREAGW